MGWGVSSCLASGWIPQWGGTGTGCLIERIQGGRHGASKCTVSHAAAGACLGTQGGHLTSQPGVVAPGWPQHAAQGSCVRATASASSFVPASVHSCWHVGWCGWGRLGTQPNPVRDQAEVCWGLSCVSALHNLPTTAGQGPEPPCHCLDVGANVCSPLGRVFNCLTRGQAQCGCCEAGMTHAYLTCCDECSAGTQPVLVWQCG